uniref:Profilin n=1 Tax=Arion vulgaris TaxID=1028688 RepID=A0A0B7AXZ4_9EUPU
MSWGAYVQNLEAGKGRCRYAGIYGKSPIGVWAESPDKSNFPITCEDVSTATRAITSQDMNIMSTGLKIGGKLNFTCLRMEPDLLICQGKGENKDYSLVIALSTQAVIIGFNPDADTKTAYVRDAIESIRDYLKNLGY